MSEFGGLWKPTKITQHALEVRYDLRTVSALGRWLPDPKKKMGNGLAPEIVTDSKKDETEKNY